MITVPPSLSASCALKPAAQQKPPTKRGTCSAVATNTSNSLNNTASPRYPGNEAHKRMDIWIVEHRLRAKRLATDRLTRATKALVWATGVLALASPPRRPAPITSKVLRMWRKQLFDDLDNTSDLQYPLVRDTGASLCQVGVVVWVGRVREVTCLKCRCAGC